MTLSSIHQLGKPVDEEMTGQSCQFKVSCAAIHECKAHNWISFPGFTTGEHFWYINCCPIKKGKKGEVDYLSFYLWYGGEWNDVNVAVDFGVLKKNEKSSSIKWKTTTQTFPNCGECFGLEKFVQGEELKMYLKEDYFTVICNIKVLSRVYRGTTNSGVIILSSLTGIFESRFIKVSYLENKSNSSLKNLIESERVVQNEIASGLFQFKIVCSHITANVGRYFDFPIFMVGEHCWLIRCYYGEDKKLSFYIVTRSATKDLRVCVEFMLKKDEDLSSAKWTSSTHTFKKCGECMVMDKFMEGDELKHYLQNDHLRVTCNFTILSETITRDHDVTILASNEQLTIQPIEEPSPKLEPKSQPIHKPSPDLQPKSQLVDEPTSNLHDHLYDMLENKERIDVIFNVNGEIFHAHKLVLAAQSSVFNAELPMDENDAIEVSVNGIRPNVFKAILHFIYTEMLPDLNESSNEENDENQIYIFQDLLVAADRYALERLKLICEDKLSKFITIDTVATTLVLAEQHNSPILKARCLQFATAPQNFVKVAVTDGYRHLLMVCPTILNELWEKLS